MRLTVKLVETWYHRFACCICGEETNKCSLQAAAFDEDGDEQGKVCERCLVSGDTLTARAHVYAAHLRRWADALDTMTVDATVTLAEKQTAEQEREREIASV